MVRHIILWKLKSDIPAERVSDVKSNMKEMLEALVGKIDGLLSMEIHVCGLDSSTCDVMLESSFADEAALLAYRTHPAHVAVADEYVRPFTETRMCLDFEV